MIRIVTLLAGLACLAVLPETAQAQDKGYALSAQIQPSRATGGEARQNAQDGSNLRYIEILTIVRRRYPQGDVLDGDLIQGSNPYYEVRVRQANGQLTIVDVDARTGRILRERRG